MEERQNPVKTMNAGRQKIDPSSSEAFAQGLDEEMDTESLLADLVAGVPDFQSELDETDAASQPAKSRKRKSADPPKQKNGIGGPVLSSTLIADTLVKAQPPFAPPGSEPRKIGRYLIEQEIGKGAAGSVYRARDTKLDRLVAIKTVRYRLGAPGLETVALKERVYREARAIAKLNHPNIVVVHDVDEAQDFCYLVMEFLEGIDLRTLLNKEHRLEWEYAVNLILQACSALECAHRYGIVHLDIKPTNLILPTNNSLLKVTDFSVDKLGAPMATMPSGRESAAHLYVAPEQREGGPVDHRTDIFSMGMALYELLTGETPFIDEAHAVPANTIVQKSYIPPSLLNLELPEEIDEIVARALSRNPAQRYQTAGEMREALTQLPYHQRAA